MEEEEGKDEEEEEGKDEVVVVESNEQLCGKDLVLDAERAQCVCSNRRLRYRPSLTFTRSS